jgi:peptide/nickel transport system permease protein
MLWAVVLFIAVTAITYGLFFIVPADPARIMAGKSASPEEVERVRKALGLDDPIYIQYAHFLQKLVVDHSLGISYANRQDVNTIVASAAPVTASLVFGGALLWILVAIPTGIVSALKPRSLVDRATMVLVLIGISAPAVWIGLILAYFFGYRLGWTPIADYCNFFPTHQIGVCSGPLKWAYHLILPWTAFMFLNAAVYTRFVRASMLETMSEDYVRTARAKGAPSRRVTIHHVLRNSLLPTVTMLGMDISLSLGGAIFTEQVFNLHGLGQDLVGAALNDDLPLVVGITIFATLAVIVFNFLVDIVYAFLDPRIRLTT